MTKKIWDELCKVRKLCDSVTEGRYPPVGLGKDIVLTDEDQKQMKDRMERMLAGEIPLLSSRQETPAQVQQRWGEMIKKLQESEQRLGQLGQDKQLEAALALTAERACDKSASECGVRYVAPVGGPPTGTWNYDRATREWHFSGYTGPEQDNYTTPRDGSPPVPDGTDER